MKILHVINNLATGGAEKLLLESIPKYPATDFVMDVMVLNGIEHPFFLDLQKSQANTLISLGKHSIYNPILIFKIIKYLKTYDVLHVHLFPSLYWVALAKMISFSSVKLVYTEHSTSNRRHNSFLFRFFDKIMYSQYTKIVCVSEEVATQLKTKLHLSASKLITIQNGIDLSKITSAEPYKLAAFNLPEESKLLLQVSSFQFPKDQATVIKCLQYLPDYFHVAFAGTGPLENDCKALAQQLHLSERVHFLGVRMDIPQLLKTADIIVLSSQYEGLSLSCVEGLSSGKVFLASDVKGLKEIVNDPELLFPFQDEKALAQLISKFISDADKYHAAVIRSQQRAKAFDIQTMIGKHIQLYNSLN